MARRTILALCALLSWPVVAEQLHLLGEDDPPHNMLVKGKVVGISADKLHEALSRAGVTSDMELIPWARAYQGALTRPGYCVFSAARTPEREPLFKWVGPIAAMDWVLYARAEDARAMSSIEAARNRVIGGYNQDVISNWLLANNFRVELAANDEPNPKKLLSGRIDFWASSRPRASAMLAANSDYAKGIKPVLAFGRTDLYLACNNATSTETIAKLNNVLRAMQTDGTSARIEALYAH
jgi:polar amino acid transport system substrate-binding protein